MTKFALLADIHEQLRLGGDKIKQLARLKTADDVIALYNFFYPTRKHGDPIRMIAYEAALFYDVVKDMLPDENTWMALASESANSGSRDYDCAYVAAMMEKATTFSMLRESCLREHSLAHSLVYIHYLSPPYRQT